MGNEECRLSNKVTKEILEILDEYPLDISMRSIVLLIATVFIENELDEEDLRVIFQATHNSIIGNEKKNESK